uniref:No apical meristem-like family protein n=1 Tax=Populus alba TaxID=43335 RepID=A0A4U5R0Z7_POPAL|nr:no apical meristem-like family protein [Populus alba]
MGTTKWRRERKKRHRILQKFRPADFFTRFLEPGELVLFDQCSFDTGEGRFSVHNLPKTAKNEWVICRVFQKSSAGKKTHISGLVRLGSFSNEFSPSGLPPLMNSSPYSCKIKPVAESVNVPCFSNPINVQRNQQDTIDCFDNHLLAVSTNPLEVFPRIPLLNPFYTPQAAPVSGNLQYPGSVLMQDHSILRALIANQGTNMKQQSFKIERDMVGVSQDSTTDMNTEIYSVVSNLEVGKRSGDDQDATPSTLVASTGLDCFWNY